MWGVVKDLFDWLNRNEGASSVILSFVIVLTTLALFRFTIRADRNAIKMYKSTELARMNSTLPVLAVSIADDEVVYTNSSSIKFPIEISNSGNGPALNPDFSWSTSSRSALGQGPTVTAISAGSSIRMTVHHPEVLQDLLDSEPYFPIGTPEEDRPKAQPTKSGTLVVSYFDVNNREHKTEVGIVFAVDGRLRPVFAVSKFVLDID